MKLVRYLEEIELLKATNVKQDNGTNIKSFELVKKYKVQKNNLDDEVNATIYGADIVKMWNISTPLKDLEKYLIPKVDNKEDNISLYFIKLDNHRYRIKSVKESGIVIERT